MKEELLDFSRKWESMKVSLADEYKREGTTDYADGASDSELEENTSFQKADECKTCCKNCPMCCFLVLQNYNL